MRGGDGWKPEGTPPRFFRLTCRVPSTSGASLRQAASPLAKGPFLVDLALFSASFGSSQVASVHGRDADQRRRADPFGRGTRPGTRLARCLVSSSLSSSLAV